MAWPRAADIQDIPFSHLISDYEETPEQAENISELMESIKTFGLLQPIVVARCPDDMFQLIAGRRRVMALVMLQATFIKAVVLDSLPDAPVAGAIWATENLVRRPPHGAELRTVFQSLLKECGSTNAIAEQTGIPLDEVQRYLPH
jgi:ParB family chromosome partitioning protein